MRYINISAVVKTPYTLYPVLWSAEQVASHCTFYSLPNQIFSDDLTAVISTVKQCWFAVCLPFPMWCDVISLLHVNHLHSSSFWVCIDQISSLNEFGESGLGYVIMLENLMVSHHGQLTMVLCFVLAFLLVQECEIWRKKSRGVEQEWGEEVKYWCWWPSFAP